MITVDEIIDRARPLIERLARDVAARAIEQAVAQLEHDLEALVAEKITPADVLDAPAPKRKPPARIAPETVRAPRACGCSATGRHRKTCELAGKGKTVDPDDDDDEAPDPKPSKSDRFALIEARRKARGTP